jgi:ComF family protein
MLRPSFAEGRTATLLQGPMRRLVHALKYEGALHLLDDFERIVRANPHFCAFFSGAILVPVPLHPRKRRERGFNQAALLADRFAQAGGAAAVRTLLRRTLDTSTQTRLDRRERQENLKNAFALADSRTIEPDSRYVLVDDVFTTGATLNACAAVLRRAGARRVDVATLGHG